MSEAAMRAEFSGSRLQGYYHTGVTWAAAYAADGEVEYRHGGEPANGHWFVQGPVFCIYYNLRLRSFTSGGCLNVIKLGSNCYEYYRAEPFGKAHTGEDVQARWHSRGWRQGEPSTCESRPSV
jgi:hypothetical protein